MEDFKKLGIFYLGRKYSPDTKIPEGILLYDSRDLVTHPVCAGMISSGKTGLCVGILNRATRKGLPRAEFVRE